MAIPVPPLSEPPADGAAGPFSPQEALQALRARAERRRSLVTQVSEQAEPREMQRLVQELQVSQIELEMQYEELLLAQADAHTARAQYVDLYDFAPVGYFTLTGAGLIRQLNLCGSQLLGTVRQRLLNRRFALFVAPGSRHEFGQFLDRVLASPATLSCELLLEGEDGRRLHAQVEGRRVPSPPDTPAPTQLCRLVVVDTSARHAATAALARSEARFRKLFADSSDAVVLLQGDTYVDGNAAALHLLGARRRPQLVGQLAWAHAPAHQPDGRSSADVFRESVQAALRLGSHRSVALMRRLTGEEMWVEAVLTPIEEAGAYPLIHMLWRNVTVERAAAEQLRASEARLSLALDASQTGIFTWDLAASRLEWDAQSQAIFGHAPAPGPVPAEVLRERIHPDDAPRVWAATEAAIDSGEPLAIAYRVVWPDGSVRHVSSAGRAVTDAQGQLTGFAGVLRDVTARHAAEEELHYKTLVLERLLGNMPMTLVRYGADGKFVEMVGAGLHVLGLEENALVGQNAFEVFPAQREPMERVLAGAQVEFQAEFEVVGQPVAFRSYGFFDAQRQQAVVLSVDVSKAERRKRELQAEKDFTESLLENSVDGIVAFNREGRITAWNSRAAAYFGHAAPAALGRPVTEVLPALDCDEARDIVRRVLAGEPVLRQGQPFGHRAGHYDAYHVPLRQQGETTGVLVMFRDVTERNRLFEEATQQRLRQQQELLTVVLTTQETERKRIAEALHNGLGQLLYATKLSLEAPGLSVPPLPQATLKLLNEAIRTTRTISFELTPGVLEDFGLRVALEELAKRIVPAGLRVELHLQGLDDRLPEAVEIGVYRMVQELLNNVMKHAAATEAVIHVAHELGRLDLSVEDNGRGFDASALGERPMAGIGLAGVRNRVALLGGTLKVNSQPGRGTIVSTELAV